MGNGSGLGGLCGLGFDGLLLLGPDFVTLDLDLNWLSDSFNGLKLCNLKLQGLILPTP